MQGTGETGRWWDAVKAQLRFGLRKLGVKIEFTDTDLRGLLASMMRLGTKKMGQTEERFSLKRGNDFARQVDRFLDGNIPHGETLTISEHTPEVLTLLGARQAPVEMTGDTATKILKGKHSAGMNADTLK
ncbi:MAG: hypothetical protein Q8O19_02030 [Rectinemataceae bacterium]|nr:hypothetical protein [Rectinemataceae bacterium]